MSSNSLSLNSDFFYLSSIKESFLKFKESEATTIDVKYYLFSLEMRSNMINWITFLCNTLNFTNISLFRTISIFDQYISKLSKKELEEMAQDQLNLITIGCLSLSTKLEEINCNYISFLIEKVLNSPNRKIYTNKDLAKMELTILKTLKFKILYSTPLDFIDIFVSIFLNFLGKSGSFLTPEIISNIKIMSINNMKDNVNNVYYLINNASHFAYLCFIQALNQLSMINIAFYKKLEKSIMTFNYQFANIF